jgi:phosphoribosylformylglycinamidine cyclo-ligase|tara:strand:- start:430 stop:1455 length:1026 start_codon:yes stop_codon:yes gene_type:complete
LGTTYSDAGVDIEEEGRAIEALISEIKKSQFIKKGDVGENLTDIGHFSALVRINKSQALAVNSDGVGTKIIIANLMEKYDTIGIDLFAMNANDLICVGAEPLTLVDYLAMDKPNPVITKEIGKGLLKGANLAKASISGGELATLPEMVNGFDLAGMMVGIVDINNSITGEKIMPGDIVVGLESSGIHSNGLTLARKILLNKYDIRSKINGVVIGDELLQPTKIYVQEVMETLKKVDIKGMVNITGGGFKNLKRVTKFGYRINHLPKVPEIFNLIQREGKVTDHEMYRTYNMGIGFCIIVGKKDVNKVISICKKYSTNAWNIGTVVNKSGVQIKVNKTKLLY